ncbi:GTPase activating protein for Arf protein [Ceratobasidium theobromae]|uniref:GTPase activating protein for Arf protein n=1 Tax=Ceratobasidium theobromae TaxID=1582974 RepID=A0A5N5Q9S2_9AGAM|nr:GTPase activating protein for Arf protein [Ceratobasidium theobromae]
MSSYTTSSAGVSKYTAERHQRILAELLQQPGNALRDSKSVNLDAWTKEQVESVKNTGNIASNAKWNPNEARHPPPTNLEESERDSEMEKYIRAKYETKKFLERKPTASLSPSSPAAASSSLLPTPASASVPAAIPRKPKPKTDSMDELDPSQTVRLGFGRESRVEFSLGPGGDIFSDIVQTHKRVPPRSQTAPIPEPVTKATPPPMPPVPAPAPVSILPSRSVSAQPPNISVPTLGVNTAAVAIAPALAIPANGTWGDMMALQTGGPVSVQASPLQQSNPYTSLSATPAMPPSLANRMHQTRSFTAPVNPVPPNPFFNQAQVSQQQQQPILTGSTGSSMLGVPTGGSFGSVGLVPSPTGMSTASFGSGGMGVSPGGAFGTNPYGTASGSLGVSPGGAFGASPIGSLGNSAFGSAPSAFGASMLSAGSAQVSLPLSQQPTSFQQSAASPFGGANSFNMGASTNTTSLSAFGAAMSPPGTMQASNSPFGQANAPMSGSNSPFQATNPAFQPSKALFQNAGSSQFQSNSPFQQSAPIGGSFLQPSPVGQFQPSHSPLQSNSPFQTANPSFLPTSNSPFQPTQPGQGTNPFGTFNAGGMNTNPFGQQTQYQGWGGM